jgi:HlyD family secretion protein
LRVEQGRRGVWKLDGHGVEFVPVVLGRMDLEGRVQIKEGLRAGDRIVIYSEKALSPQRRVRVVEAIAGVKP